MQMKKLRLLAVRDVKEELLRSFPVQISEQGNREETDILSRIGILQRKLLQKKAEQGSDIGITGTVEEQMFIFRMRNGQEVIDDAAV